MSLGFPTHLGCIWFIIYCGNNLNNVKFLGWLNSSRLTKVFKNHDKVCIFQPHRISRLKDLKKEFTYAFRDADTVILCPIYTAGEKIKLGFNYDNFAREIIKNSNVKLYIVKNKIELAKYLKQNMYGKKIVVGMGAGSITNWIKDLPGLM